jgi:HTH-type transcriptional regulator/antitoxin HigA
MNALSSIRPIRTEADHAQAIEEIARLWSSNDPEAVATVEVLSVLVDSFEREHHPIPPPDPIAAIEFGMEQLGLNRTQLGAVLGSRSRATEVLSRQRPLTLRMIRRLTAEIQIPADVLIREARPNRTLSRRATKRVRKGSGTSRSRRS